MGCAVTDTIQLLICIIFLPIISVIGVSLLNAETGVTLGSLLSSPFFETPDAAGIFLYSLLPTVIGSMFAYEYFLRYQSAKSEKDARNSSILAGFLLILLAIPIGIIGAMGQRLYPDVDPVLVLGHVVNNALPKWASHLFLAAVLAAIMSTADSLMTSLSGMVTRDIYHKLFNPSKKFDDLKNVLLIARITTIVGCLVAMLISLRFSSIMGLMFWTKASRSGAFASIIIGACVALLDMTGVFVFPERMLVTMAASSIALIVVSLLKPTVS